MKSTFVAGSAFLRTNCPPLFAMSTDATCSAKVGIDYPELVVFDLDACLWDQEM